MKNSKNKALKREKIVALLKNRSTFLVSVFIVSCERYTGLNMKISDTVKGDLSVWISSVLFAIVAVLVRGLSAHYSAIFISLIRFIVGAALAVFSIKISGRSLALDNKRDLFWRSFFGVLSMLLYYGSMALSGSSRGTLLNTLYPIFVVIFGAAFFSHPFQKKDIISLLFAVPGIFVIFWDGTSLTSLGDLLGLGSGLAAGMSTHFMKRARETNSSEIIYMSEPLSKVR